MREIFVGRQPIFDRDLEVVAYELLFRDQQADGHAAFDDPEEATARVVLNTFMELGLTRIVGDRRAFINLPRSFVLGTRTYPFPPDRVILEIVEDLVVDDAFIDGLRRLRSEGYQLALDDFAWDSPHRALLDFVDVVKLDVLEHAGKALEEQLERLRPYDVGLIAEKIETRAMFERCHDLGFDYFQGFFLSRPTVVSGERATTTPRTALALLAMLEDPILDIERIGAVIGGDAILDERLRRLSTSLTSPRRRPVGSVSEALSTLGSGPLRRWLGLVGMACLDDAPEELVSAALVRAHMAETLAREGGHADYPKFYAVGLLSAMEGVLGVPMWAILEPLDLSADVKRALLHHDGPAGAALRCVLAYEEGLFDEVEFEGLSPERIRAAWIEAVAWAHDALAEIGDDPEATPA